MGFSISDLWKAPAVNPLNQKARAVPIFNPINKYGRVFYFSTFSFMIAFLSWYAFPPLLTVTIKKDLKLTTNQVANSNILALTATLIVRLIVGPLCDRFGPRYVFAGVLLIGSIPTALAGTIHNATGLIIIRFFIGILGGSFVPCQVWSTGFFDKNIVGTANALMAGIGNAGGGITFFVMPAVFDSLVSNQHLSAHKAWRIAFIVPFILIVSAAIGMLLLCEDTPTGSWANRARALESLASSQGIVVDLDHAPATGNVPVPFHAEPSPSGSLDGEKDMKAMDAKNRDPELAVGQVDAVVVASSEIIRKPSFKEAMAVVFSLQTFMLAAAYATSFGAELSVNSILGNYYFKNFPKLGQTGTGRWAAMFGLLNVICRPVGGIVSDAIYRKTGSVRAKQIWFCFLATLMGVFAIAIGKTDSHHQSTMFGLVAGFAFFLEATNGANFSLVPHVHPHANGILSGVIGASGNLGGIIFAVIFRYNGTHYGRVIWIIGIVQIVVALGLISWVKPIPKGQISH